MNKYKPSEIKLHNKRADCWIIIDNNVVNITTFLKLHPAGEDVILEHGGKDATHEFDKCCHSNSAYELMLKYKIGEIDLIN